MTDHFQPPSVAIMNLLTLLYVLFSVIASANAVAVFPIFPTLPNTPKVSQSFFFVFRDTASSSVSQAIVKVA